MLSNAYLKIGLAEQYDRFVAKKKVSQILRQAKNVSEYTARYFKPSV